MSGDVQPRKRKDKKRKKDDEDTVKETPAPKQHQQSSGAAQAATQPGDVQMHVHDDHGTGGHWCAKIVFFILLAGLGALIGLIILENRGVSNVDTPLSESRYAEYFSGWVDENREDDHHHEEILDALNQLDDHDDDHDDEGHGEEGHDDHDDDGHDDDEEGEAEDDGTPYAEEEDHDDEQDGQEDDEDEEDLPKLDDDEVEEIVATEEKVAQQEAAFEADNDDDDDEPSVAQQQDDDDDDDDNDQPANVDDDDDDDDDAASIAKEIDELADDDDDDNSPFDEENKTNALNEQANQTVPDSSKEDTKTDETVDKKRSDPEKKKSEPVGSDSESVISAEVLKSQMDELVENYNILAEMLDLPKEEPTTEVPFIVENVVPKDDNDNDDDQFNAGDRSKPIDKDNGNDDDDDDDDDDGDNEFENFVDNDGGEEEYLAKLKKEQQQRSQEKQQQEKDQPREESSQIPSRPSESQTYEEELNRARRQLDELKNPTKALDSYESLLRKLPRLVPALVGKARALDALAEQKQNNAILGEAIEAYRNVVFEVGESVDDETFKSVAERCIDRTRFRGQYLVAVDVHQALIRRFDTEPKYRNQLAVTYLLANRLAEAKVVLHETLMRWIEDGFALVHYGFVLKNHDKDMAQAVEYLREGIETGHEGTQDGRFYFHLGDALQRLGRQEEALDVYRKAAEKKLFLSAYQRSLYNVDSLKSRPFWTIEQTTYASQLELIRSQWIAIRDEGLKLLNSAGNFKDEAENLRDTGDWKQFELFFRGHRVEKNCAKAPLTCRLVDQFQASRSCKRGQVKFSVMHPGTHVWPHCGPTNCRIRAHLGLKVPSGTAIRVAEETRSWENGKWLIFDDSFEHEVWHNGTSLRLVLIVDFWHPDLTESQRKSLSPI